MAEILHGVYPEPKDQTLRFTQGDRRRRVQNDRRRVQNDRRRVQNDKHGISLIATQSLMGEGQGEKCCNPSVRGDGICRSARNVIENLIKQMFQIFIGKGNDRYHQ